MSPSGLSPSTDVHSRPALSRIDLLRGTARSLQMGGHGLIAVALFVKSCAVHVLRRTPSPIAHAAGESAVYFCTRLGATFIKVGQIASTRVDLLPRAFASELARLQDRVPAFPFEIVRSTIEGELGHSVEDLFVEFETSPVAAASVAQVHRARLREDGRVVAVKVRRPDIVEKVRLDRSILVAIAHFAERCVPTLRLVALEEAITGFCDAVEHQLDLRHEAANNRRFRANFADDPAIVFPELWEPACSASVLTMSFLEGVHERDLEAEGIDIEGVVTAGMRAVCRMIFQHAFVHADLHPGNLLFAPPARIILLDLGLIGTMDEIDRVTTAQLLFSLSTGDGKTVARLFYENAPHTATPDYGAYEREVIALVDDVRHQGLANLQVTVEIGRIFDILRRHKVQARAHMTMVNLALMTAEGLGRRLAPDIDLTQEALPYLAEALGIPVPAPSSGAAG